MAISYNRTIQGGNLTRDPEVKFFANEKAVATFGLAINRKWRDKEGNQKEETTFVDIECWGSLAERVGQYLSKGKSCLVEGRLKLDQWEDKQGNKRSKLKVVADTVQFLDKMERNGAQSKPQGDSSAPPPATPSGESYNEDEPPF